MHDLLASALSGSAVDILLVLSLVFLAGAITGYLARLWREARSRRRRRTASAASPRQTADAVAGRAAAEALRLPADVGTRVVRPPDRPRGRPVEVAHRPTVLLADDQRELVTLHGAYLEHHGYRVVTATDGDMALEVARTERPSIIVLDHTMPGRSGIDVARALKRDPSTAGIPVLLMTAHSYGAVGASARDAGCVGFMSKPCDPSRLLREITAFVRPAAEPQGVS